MIVSNGHAIIKLKYANKGEYFIQIIETQSTEYESQHGYGTMLKIRSTLVNVDLTYIVFNIMLWRIITIRC